MVCFLQLGKHVVLSFFHESRPFHEVLHQVFELFQVVGRVSKEMIYKARHAEGAFLRFLEFAAESGEALLAAVAGLGEATECGEQLLFLRLAKGDNPVNSPAADESLIEAASAVGRETHDRPFGRRSAAVHEVQKHTPRNTDAIFVPRSLPAGRERKSQRIEVFDQQNAVGAYHADELVADGVAHPGERQGVEIPLVLECQSAHEAALSRTGHAHEEQTELANSTCSHVALAVGQETVHVLQKTGHFFLWKKQVLEGLRGHDAAFTPLTEATRGERPDLPWRSWDTVLQCCGEEGLQCVSVTTGHSKTAKVVGRVPARRTFFLQLHDEHLTFMHPGMATDAEAAQERLGIIVTGQKTV